MVRDPTTGLLMTTSKVEFSHYDLLARDGLVSGCSKKGAGADRRGH